MMAEEKSYYMTEEGKEKLENELHVLKTEKRKEVVERIKIARDFGDLSENSEYDSAKEEQAFVETRIAQLEKMIRNAVIIENDEANADIVSLGKQVTFVELPDGEEETYKIVGRDRKSTRLNSSHVAISYAVFCLKKKKNKK